MKYAMNPKDSGPVTASDELSAQADLHRKSSAAGRSQKIIPLPMTYAMNPKDSGPATASNELPAQADLHRKSSAAGRSQKIIDPV